MIPPSHLPFWAEEEKGGRKGSRGMRAGKTFFPLPHFARLKGRRPGSISFLFFSGDPFWFRPEEEGGGICGRRLNPPLFSLFPPPASPPPSPPLSSRTPPKGQGRSYVSPLSSAECCDATLCRADGRALICKKKKKCAWLEGIRSAVGWGSFFNGVVG